METKIAFVASNAPDAQAALRRLSKRYGNCKPREATHIVALGGDGFMLATQHEYMNSGLPIYGMNKGTVGFLMNEYGEDDLETRLATSTRSHIRPLEMEAEDISGKIHKAQAINEVSLLRQSYQAASLSISIDGKIRLNPLICDGVLVATPAGSTAYNLSAHGPILPLEAPLLALTPVSPFRPRRWRGALIPNTSEVLIEVLDVEKRPVNAVADHTEIKSVRRVRVRQDSTSKGIILFDRDHSWDERILAEQFQY
ncbi:MAG: NAD kinase [Nitratireductor sp.]